ncbi:ABC transporter ATP-binding protein [Spirochaeta africana]|uniref:ABC-type multidrug transport system, ATPase component n=1 Tax=Spirochaeta africana (strain ATCC 700263 / DSM 8902 / Z-7692) TaxID=889378 RepID=H9UIJ2_SPIAZ|nr:ABC transporter ATP-binding protein [Spirochaeta africana]AFG37335.1 ABC-type multidrug transport system, ATPase component [Spirochaeta africana DSM 8902]
MTPAIEIRNLYKTYRNGTEALSGLSMQVARNCTTAVLGPNGAGKSTLVRSVCGLCTPDRGEVLIQERRIQPGSRDLATLIGVAGQDNDLDPDETALQHLWFQSRLYRMSRATAHHRIEELVELFQLQSHLEKPARNLSGGTRRKLHCALALIHRPQLLILDEPTVGMDPEVRQEFWQAIDGFVRQQQGTVLLTTQYLEEVDRHAAQMILLVDGISGYQGCTGEFKKHMHPDSTESLENSYLTFIRQHRHSIEQGGLQ